MLLPHNEDNDAAQLNRAMAKSVIASLNCAADEEEDIANQAQRPA